ncbi:phosphoethanolamine transferase [Stenoxybacter acetivorans]|uniref:phosphoethanolamine transferase n=1 Tax=Stenoxybacter acetivorans TaxID=422441 RepID=UPI00055AB366|nr:phosphoethanolamine transferase [Stenoxybacter acetivorans]
MFETYLLLRYGDFSDGILDAILNTNSAEALAFLRAKIIVIIIAVASGLLLTYLLFINAVRRPKWSLLWLLPVAVFWLSLEARQYRHQQRMVQFSQNNPGFKIINQIDRLDNYFAHNIRQRLPLVLGDYFYIFHSKKISNLESSLTRQTPPFLAETGNPAVKHIIVVIGESANPKRHGVYGYQAQDTTPNLNRIGNELCVKSPAHSMSNMTRTALPPILSFAEPENFGRAYTDKNIIDLAKERGYATAWLGAQEIQTLFSSTYGPLAKSAYTVITPDYTTQQQAFRPSDDLDLLPQLAQLFRQPQIQQTLYVLHLTGSHAPYRHDKTDQAALPNADSYDLSVHHTDRVLQGIMDLANQHLPEYVLLYTSDHGEILVDEGGGVEHGSTFGGYEQYRVPLLLKSADPYWCEQWEQYRKRSGQFSNESVKYLLLQMMGLRLNTDTTFDDKILHSDYAVYNFENLPTPKDKNNRFWEKKGL